MLPGWDKLQDLRRQKTVAASEKLDQHLAQAIAEFKPETMMADQTPLPPRPAIAPDVIRKNVTGAGLLGDELKATLAKAKASVEAAQAEVAKAAANVSGAAEQALDLAKAMNTEAADLLASIGQTSNMPPK